MTISARFKFFLWYFGHFKVPLIGYLKPRLLELTEKKIIVKLPLSRRSKNHLNSMYFGALAVGADVAGGFHGFYHAAQAKLKVSLVFKAFQAQFLRRPESDVYFICEMGDEIKEMITASHKMDQRITRPIQVKAFINYPQNPEEIAHFILDLSIKVLPSG